MDGGEHIGQVANFLYARWRIPGYRMEGRLPRSEPPYWRGWRRHLEIYYRVVYGGVCGKKRAKAL